MKIPKNNLRFRLSATLGLVVVLSLLLGGVLIYQILFSSIRNSIQQQLQTASSTLLTLGISDFSRLKSFRELDEFIEDALGMEKAGKVIRIFDHRGRLAFSTMGLDYDELPGYLDPRLGSPTFSTLQGKNRRYEALTVPYLGKGRTRSFYLQIVMPMPRFSHIFQTFWWQALVWFVVLMVLTVFLSRWLSERLLRPVKNMAEQIGQWDPHHPDRWEPLHSDVKGAYLGEIEEGVNDMALRTQQVIDKLRKITRFIAHEMRTPLTIIQGETETLLLKNNPQPQEYEAVLKSSQEEVERLSKTIDTILKIGETSPQRMNAHWTRKNLGEWMGNSLSLWRRYLTQDRQIREEFSENISLKTDWELLFQLMDNLVRNFQKHTPPGSVCRICTSLKGGNVFLEIRDNGPGMKEPEPGSPGLGLYLSRAISEILGTQMSVESKPGSGFTVTLKFDAQ